jgi:dienelactone hydrolase
MQQRREQIVVDNDAMNLVISQPDSDGPLPAVVVIQHQYGVDKFMEEMTERFAGDGLFAVCPDLYHRDPPDCADDGPTRRGRARDVNIRIVGATLCGRPSERADT